MNAKQQVTLAGASLTREQDQSRTITHHPDQNMLAEYVTGSLDFSTAMSVSAHLSYCEKCRSTVKTLEAIGGSLLEQQEIDGIEVNDDCFDAIMKRIDQEPSPHSHQFEQLPINDDDVSNQSDLPDIVKKLIPNQSTPVKWTRIGLSLHTANLESLDDQHQISLHRIQAGSSVFEHDHNGEEVTLVLKGSFSDEDGMYQQGDFIVKKPGEVHRPMAAKNEDCVCLVVQAAPVKFTGFFTRYLNPLLKKP